MSLLKEFYIILYASESIVSFKEICRYKGCIINYDTTFNLGDLYVSALIYRHPLCRNSPVVMLAVLIHHNRTAEVHKRFLQHIKAASHSTRQLVKNKKNAENVDINTYESHVWDLLNSNTENKLMLKYKTMQEQWTEAFRKYCNRYSLNDIKMNTKWILEEVRTFYDSLLSCI